jgi:hypothetical protein
MRDWGASIADAIHARLASVGDRGAPIAAHQIVAHDEQRAPAAILKPKRRPARANRLSRDHRLYGGADLLGRDGGFDVLRCALDRADAYFARRDRAVA